MKSGTAKSVLTVLACTLLATGFVVAITPGILDFREHWEMFVGRLGYFVPGFAMMFAGAIGLILLEK